MSDDAQTRDPKIDSNVALRASQVHGSDPSGPPALPALAWTVWAIALGQFVLHIACAARYGYFRDELYFVACSKHLAWSYVDQPPFVVLLTRLVIATLGDSLYALRFFPALSMSLVVLMGGILTLRMGGRSYAQTLAALCLALAPAYLAVGAILTMNAFDILCWTIIQLLLLRLIERDGLIDWVILGVVMGVGLLTKHSIAFFAIALAVAVLLTPRRRWYARRGLWMAVIIAIAFAVPMVWWQIAHGWPTAEFMRIIHDQKNYPVSPFEFAAMQFAVVHPFIFPVWVAGLVWLFKSRRAKAFRLFGWAYAILFLTFMVLRAKFYYLFPIYPVLMAAGGIAIEQCVARRRVWAYVIPAFIVLTTAATAPFAVPILNPEQFQEYANALDLQRHLRFEVKRDRKMPIVYSDMFGWQELTETVAKVYVSLPESEQRDVVIFAANYGEAGAIDFFGEAYGLPHARSIHNAYHTWGPGDAPWHTVIAIGFDAATLQEYFEEVTSAGQSGHPFAREQTIDIHVCRTPKRPIREVWPEMHSYH